MRIEGDAGAVCNPSDEEEEARGVTILWIVLVVVLVLALLGFFGFRR